MHQTHHESYNVIMSFQTLTVTQWSIRTFLPRDAMYKRGLCRRALSVRLSARPCQIE